MGETMTRLTEKLRDVRAAFLLACDRFRDEARGVAAVEFAFIAPIMLLLFVGTIELSAGVSVNRKLSRLSSTLSDLVTQSQTLTANDINNIMDAAAKVMHPYPDNQVQIVITGVAIDNNQAKVDWSCARNDTKLASGTNYSGVPTKIRKNGTFLVAAVVKTSYTPSFGWAQYSQANGLSFDRTAIQMEEEIFLRPRIGSKVNVPPACT
jgi:Flp pilus assembly protein TadG